MTPAARPAVGAHTRKPLAGEKTMHDFATINQRYERYRQATARANDLNKGAVFDALDAAGITEIIAELRVSSK
jgi:hypothetical protein